MANIPDGRSQQEARGARNSARIREEGVSADQATEAAIQPIIINTSMMLTTCK